MGWLPSTRPGQTSTFTVYAVPGWMPARFQTVWPLTTDGAPRSVVAPDGAGLIRAAPGTAVKPLAMLSRSAPESGPLPVAVTDTLTVIRGAFPDAWARPA